MRLSSLLPCSALLLLSCSGSDGPTEPPPTPPPPAAIALASSDTSIALPQGDTLSVTLTMSRTNYLAQVLLSANSLPAGVTATITPSTLLVTDPSATIQLVAGTFATVGDHIVRIGAAGPGSVSTNLFLTISVSRTGGLTVSVPEGGLAFDQDDGGQVEVTVGREGSFVGPVTLSHGDLPAGLTAAFLPAAVSGTNTVLAFTASTATPVGTHEVEVIASATGWDSDTTTIPITVGAQGAITPVTVNFCFGTVLWVGFANRNGAWQEATSAGGTLHTAALSQPTGAIAWVDGSGTTHVYRGSIAELQDMAAWRDSICALGVSVNEKGLTGIAAGVAAGQRAQLAMFGARGASGFTVTGPDSAYGFYGLPEGPLTLTAVRTGPNLADGRFVVRRGVDLAHQSVIPRMDFDSPEAEPLESATMTITNAIAASARTASVYILSTSTYFNLATPTAFTYQGPSASLLEPGESHSMFVSEGRGPVELFLGLRFTDIVDRDVAFGPEMAEPERRTLVNGSPLVVELRLPLQAEYADSVKANFLGMNLTVRSGYLLGGDRWELSLPRMTTAPSYNPAWAPSTGPGYAIRMETFGTGAPVYGATIDQRSIRSTYYYLPDEGGAAQKRTRSRR